MSASALRPKFSSRTAHEKKQHGDDPKHLKSCKDYTAQQGCFHCIRMRMLTVQAEKVIHCLSILFQSIRGILGRHWLHICVFFVQGDEGDYGMPDSSVMLSDGQDKPRP